MKQEGGGGGDLSDIWWKKNWEVGEVDFFFYFNVYFIAIFNVLQIRDGDNILQNSIFYMWI